MKTTMRAFGVGAALAITFAASPAVAQAGPRGGADGDRLPLMGRAPLVETLIRRQEALGLSADQVARLEAIRARLEEQNAPLEAQLATVERPTEAEREAMRERMREAVGADSASARGEIRERMRGMTPEERREAMGMPREVLTDEHRAAIEQMRINSAAALQEAMQVLTPEQLARARLGMREMRADARGAMPMGGRGRMAPGARAPGGRGTPRQGR